uniref:C2H2-type domain-containing protein n=1 Tax=Clytia hemisphaerica TaxID=252671 RepID=A0A7M5WMG4_9CNID
MMNSISQELSQKKRGVGAINRLNEPPNQKRYTNSYTIDAFNQNPPISPLPPKLPDTLGELLAEYNLQMYLPKLEGEALDVATFLELCDNDLKELGIDKFGPRKKMLLAIRECKERKAAHDPNKNCKALMETSEELQEHLIGCHAKPIFVCSWSECKSTFETKAKFLVHLKRHSG